jgi:hypothetical protein
MPSAPSGAGLYAQKIESKDHQNCCGLYKLLYIMYLMLHKPYMEHMGMLSDSFLFGNIPSILPLYSSSLQGRSGKMSKHIWVCPNTCTLWLFNSLL